MKSILKIIITLMLTGTVTTATPLKFTAYFPFGFPTQLELSFNDDNGEFVGMLQNGTYIQVYNHSALDCRKPD